MRIDAVSALAALDGARGGGGRRGGPGPGAFELAMERLRAMGGSGREDGGDGGGSAGGGGGPDGGEARRAEAMLSSLMPGAGARRCESCGGPAAGAGLCPTCAARAAVKAYGGL